MSHLLLLLVSCTPDAGFKTYNSSPSATILTPSAGQQFYEYEPIALQAQVNDNATAIGDLRILWSAEGMGELPGTASTDGDVARLVVDAGLSAGDWTITVLVTDEDAASAEDDVSITVVQNLPPSVTLLSPAAGARYAEGTAIPVSAFVTDVDAASNEELALTWSVGDGPAFPDATGYATFELTDLPVGDHSLSVTVTDAGGDSALATAAFEVYDADIDGDGYSSDDCNDSDATIHPGADETCDTIDNDCDLAVDEDGGTSWYADTDADGYGGGSAVVACSQPSGYAAVSGDCDDADPQVNPGAVEVCNSADDDCDSEVDEDVGTDWFVDADGDGYGDGLAVVACDAPVGHAALSGDCDDGDVAYNPGAAEACDDPTDYNCDGSTGYLDADGDGIAACEDCDDTRALADETCNDLDDDCDGEVDEDSATDASVWYVDRDADGYGVASAFTLACDLPAGYADNPDDCDDADDAVYPDAPETCDGEDQDCDGTVDDGAADPATWYLDGDGDGYGDGGGVEACEEPVGYAALDGDCDDGDAEYNPGASEFCDDPADYNCDGASGYADADGDGLAACEDCDDTRALTDESCNDLDDDCDGTVDEDVGSEWFADGDDDGYGAGAATTACGAPDGFVGNDEDCDDADALVAPGASETCDEVDEDCDGDLDEGVGTEWFADEDGDGYGDGSATVACEAPTGAVAGEGDCDDGDADTFPGAAERESASECMNDDDGDGFGDETVSGGVEAGTDCDDGDEAVFPGATEVADGIDSDCDGLDEVCGGATLEVPSEYPTIQDAIDAACDGDVVDVGAGTYVENIDFSGKEITVQGAGADVTTIDGDYNGTSVVTMDGGTLDGVTITNGLALYGGGVYVTGGVDVELANVIVRDNYSANTGGGAHLAGTGLELTNVEVDGNEAGSHGGGLYVAGSLQATGVTISGNVGTPYGGGIFAAGTVDLQEAVISGNSATHGGGVFTQGTVELIGAVVSGNSATYGGGVYSDLNNGPADLSGAMLSGNSAGAAGGGVWAGGSGTLSLGDAVVSENTSSSSGAGVYVYLTSYNADFSGSTVTGNIAGDHGGGVYAYISNAKADFSRATISGNSASGNAQGGGVYLQALGSTTVTISQALFAGNSVGNLASTYAGGIYAYCAAGGELLIDGCAITGNGGVGLTVDTSGTSDAVSVINITVVENSSHGIYVRPSWVKQINLENVVAAHNEGYGLVNTSTTYDPVFSYSNVHSNVFGEYSGFADPTGTDGNLSVDPEFMLYSADIDSDRWDLHLCPGSPLIDAGDPSILDPDGSRSDIGAYGGPDADFDYYDDADGDTMYDGWEDSLGLDSAADDSTSDFDGDGLSNVDEFNLCVDASDADTDDDGLSDYDEILTYSTDPLDSDSDDDGTDDYDELAADDDGDGYSGFDDCDDDDADVSPAASESCNGIDDDCDDIQDDGFPDTDGDGTGDCADTNYAAAIEGGGTCSSYPFHGLTVGGAEFVDVFDSSYTIEGWFYFPSDVYWMYGIEVPGALFMRTRFGTFSYGPGGLGTTEHFAGSVAASDWTHMAFSISDSGAWHIFLDGALVESGTSAGALSATSNQLYFGYSSEGYGNVYMDALRVSDTQRYTAAFTPDSRPEADSSTYALWTFDEGSGTTVYDYSGNSFDLDWSSCTKFTWTSGAY